MAVVDRDKLTMTVTVGRFRRDARARIASVLAADKTQHGEPDLRYNQQVEDHLMVVWKRLSLLMESIADDIALRSIAAAENGLSEDELLDLAEAKGEYEAAEKIRTEIIGPLLR